MWLVALITLYGVGVGVCYAILLVAVLWEKGDTPLTLKEWGTVLLGGLLWPIVLTTVLKDLR